MLFNSLTALYEPCHEKACLQWFTTRSDANRAVQPKKMIRDLKFWISEVEGLYYIAKTIALITAQLICAFVFAYVKSSFSLDMAHMSRVVRKPVFGVSDQVPHKPGCTTTPDG